MHWGNFDWYMQREDWGPISRQVLQTRTQAEIKNILWGRLRKWTYGCQRKGIVREFGKVMYTLLYSKWITNKVYCSTWNSTQCYVPGWMGRKTGGEWIHVCTAESQRCSPEPTTTLLIGYTSIQNEKLKKNPVGKSPQTVSSLTTNCNYPSSQILSSLVCWHRWASQGGSTVGRGGAGGMRFWSPPAQLIRGSG